MVESGLIHNRTRYVKYKCRCDVCVQANSLYKLRYQKTRSYPLRLDGRLLVDRLRADDRTGAVDRKAVERWLKNGIDLYAADRVCVKLGYHPVEIWGQDFYRGVAGE